MSEAKNVAYEMAKKEFFKNSDRFLKELRAKKTRMDILERLAQAAIKALDKDWFDDNLKLDETKALEKIILELVCFDADSKGEERP